MSADVATIEELAEVSFEAVQCNDEMPTLDEWLDRARNQFVTTRLALALVTKSSAELVQSFIEAEDPDDLQRTMISLGDCINDLKGWHENAAEILTSASTRIMIALSHVAVERQSVKE